MNGPPLLRIKPTSNTPTVISMSGHEKNEEQKERRTSGWNNTAGGCSRHAAKLGQEDAGREEIVELHAGENALQLGHATALRRGVDPDERHRSAGEHEQIQGPEPVLRIVVGHEVFANIVMRCTRHHEMLTLSGK